MNQKLIFSNDFNAALDEILADCDYNRLFVIADVNIDRFVMPRIADNPHIASAVKIVTKCGDVNKNIDTLAEVWSGLQQGGATRHSMVLNIGGGVITDMGGFAASTFKRGMRFVNIPTTLLAAVDAAVGGKAIVNKARLIDIAPFEASYKDLEICYALTILAWGAEPHSMRIGYAHSLYNSIRRCFNALGNIAYYTHNLRLCEKYALS